MRRNIILFLSLLLLSATVTVAQTTVIKGSFKKAGVQNILAKEIYVGTADNGNLHQVLANILKPEDYAFQFGVDNTLGILGQIVFIGSEGEFYPLYVGEGETIDLRVDRGQGVLTGKLGKENQVLARWISIMSPLRQLVYTAEGRGKPAEEFHKAITRSTDEVAALLSGLNTGNARFDADARQVLKYLTMLDVLHMFDQGMCFNTQADYPKYIQTLFSTDVFSDMSVMRYSPVAFDLLMLYGFGRHIIYNGQMGGSAEFVADDISCPELRSTFILKAIERGMIWDLQAFDAKNGSLVLPADRARYDLLRRRIFVNQEGAAWVDFTYPDLNGTKRSLSDYRGKVVVVDVWATWCAPCKAEIPHLEELEKQMKGRDVVFISVSIDTDHAKWTQFVREKGLGGVQLFSNNKGVIVDDYQLDGVPRFMVFSKQGTTVSTNAPRPSTPELKAMIEKELAK